MCAISSLLLALSMHESGAVETETKRGKAEHVVLVACDGMRPDFVTEAHAPTLWKLARSGVVFRNHHSVYPSLTTVNTTALATGAYPSRSGLIANYEYRPELDPAKPMRMDAPATAARADQVTAGKFLGTATVAEIVQASGGRCAIAGTKTASVIHDRHSPGSAKKRGKSISLFDGKTLPQAALDPLVHLLGPYPDKTEFPNASQDRWTTRALTDCLWKDDVPPFSVLWLSDPDKSQHATAPGSAEALAAIKSADANLALVLAALEKKGVRDKTDIFVVSDHGFSTIERSVNIAALLKNAGFELVTGADPKLARGQIRFAGNGGTSLFYVGEHDRDTIARLVDWLQQSDFAGVIFSREPIEGTFRLAQAQIDSPSAADVVIAMRWNDEKNQHGVPGLILANGSSEEGRGTHGTLSRFDVHNTLVAAGPDFHAGIASELPSSNLDVAPTILHILGLTPPEPMNGRVLAEAMLDDRLPVPAKPEVRTIEATRRTERGVWRQYLRLSEIGASVYLDEGNGEVRP